MKPRFTFSLPFGGIGLLILLAGAVAPISARAANTTDTFLTGTDLSTGTNWSTGIVPAAGVDATFNASYPAGSATFTLSGNATYGSLDDLNPYALEIDPATGAGAVTLTLGGSGSSNATSGANAATLLYVASGGSLTLGSGSGSDSLGLVFAQGGTTGQEVLNNGTLTINSSLNGGGFQIGFGGTGTTIVNGFVTNLGTNSGASAGATLILNGGGTFAGSTTAGNLVATGGTLTFGGGTFTDSGILFAHKGGTVNVNGGIVNANGGVEIAAMNTGDSTSTNTLNINGGTLIIGAGKTFLSNHRSSIGILNLNGGVLNTGSAITTDSTYAGQQVNFNGGTYQLSATLADILGVGGATVASSYTFTVKTGGAIFDTNGFTLGIAEVLTSGGSTDGGLTKQGLGTLTLSGNNTYVGRTSVARGTLALATGGSIAQSRGIDVAAGATFNVSGLGGTYTFGAAASQTVSGSGTVNNGANTTVIASGSTLAPSSVAQAPSTLTFTGNLTLDSGSLTNLAIYSGSADSVSVTGILAYGGYLVVTISGVEVASTYDLFTGETSSSGDFASVTVDGVALTETGAGIWTGTGSQGETATFYTSGALNGDLVLSAAPEPGTWVLLAGGLALLASLRRGWLARRSGSAV